MGLVCLCKNIFVTSEKGSDTSCSQTLFACSWPKPPQATPQVGCTLASGRQRKRRNKTTGLLARKIGYFPFFVVLFPTFLPCLLLERTLKRESRSFILVHRLAQNKGFLISYWLGCTFSPPKQTDRLATEYICNMSFFENKPSMKTGA